MSAPAPCAMQALVRGKIHRTHHTAHTGRFIERTVPELGRAGGQVAQAHVRDVVAVIKSLRAIKRVRWVECVACVACGVLGLRWAGVPGGRARRAGWT